MRLLIAAATGKVNPMGQESAGKVKVAAVTMLARLLPYVSDHRLVTEAVQLCLFSGAQSLPLPAASTVGANADPGLGEEFNQEPLQQSGVICPEMHTACNLLDCTLTVRQHTAILGLLHKLDAASNEGSPVSTWLWLYLDDLFRRLESLVEQGSEQSQPAASMVIGNPTLVAIKHLQQLATMLTKSQPGQTGKNPAERSSFAAVLGSRMSASCLPQLATLLAASDREVAAAAATCLMQLLPGFGEVEIQSILKQTSSDGGSSKEPNSSDAAAVAFFSPEQKVQQRNKQPTRAQDFKNMADLLETHIQMRKLAKKKVGKGSTSTQVRLPVIPATGATALQSQDCSDSTAADSMVMTPTTLENLNRILDVVDNPAALLLEGPTGVGKSATVIEAARSNGKKLVRFNMSSQITPDDLMGRVMIKGAGGNAAGDGISFQLQLQPFAAAFVAGDWLLLDELNLAPDDVLQCIEQALDTQASVCDVETMPLQYHCGTQGTSLPGAHALYQLCSTPKPKHCSDQARQHECLYCLLKCRFLH